MNTVMSSRLGLNANLNTLQKNILPNTNIGSNENTGFKMLNKVKGNLLDMAENGEFNIIVQGCNCFNVMGAGIARQIAERYPNVQDADLETTKGSIGKLGNWTAGFVMLEKHRFIVINAYTQYGTSADGSDVFEYDSFAVILRKLAHEYGGLRFGFPYIGMGLAGGDKKRILAMIENFAKEISAKGGTVTLVEFG